MGGIKDTLFGDTPYLPFGGEPPSQKHSETSKAAAKAIKPKLGRLHYIVLQTLRDRPQGETHESLIDITGICANTLRPRCRELELMGKIRDSGRKRLVRSGLPAVVWEIVP